MNAPQEHIRQHLIDPELCIRCGACEEACIAGAISHDMRNFVIDFERCVGHLECTHGCSTGAINTWHELPSGRPYTLEEQFSWDALPVAESVPPVTESAQTSHVAVELPPWSAAHPYVNLYTVHRPATATIARNQRVTGLGAANDIHHIVLDFGTQPFPVLEGQSIGVIAPGADDGGRPHHMRAYSVASPRGGEDPQTNRVALTVKRVIEDYEGNPVVGVCSNHLCDLEKGATVTVVGPFGSTFLMPDHPHAKLLMVGTGTGIAPMRAMIERSFRRFPLPREETQAMLFYGGRDPEEMPYYESLQALKGLVDVNMALSRLPGQRKTYVQDLIRERHADVATLLKDSDSYLFVCGLRGMEQGVIEALRDVCSMHGVDFDALRAQWLASGRWHIETY